MGSQARMCWPGKRPVWTRDRGSVRCVTLGQNVGNVAEIVTEQRMSVEASVNVVDIGYAKQAQASERNALELG
jgi:hypothetical protein